MDADRFDAIARAFTAGTSRRAVFGAVGAALSILPVSRPDLAEAAKGKKPLKKNAFGCVNVGGKCRGKDGNCCSGICKGKKPKKGERDTSRCIQHDASTCQQGQQLDECGGTSVACTTTAGESGECTITTGNGAYCFQDGDCFPCTRDTDCEGVCGPGAACMQCALCPGGTGCVGTSNCTI